MPDSLTPAPASPAFEQILRLPLRVHRQVVNGGRLVQILDRDSRVLAVMKNAAEPKEAVANLFGSAPQLLAALKRVAQHCIPDPEHTDTGGTEEGAAALEDARRAIAAAEGRQYG